MVDELIRRLPKWGNYAAPVIWVEKRQPFPIEKRRYFTSALRMKTWAWICYAGFTFLFRRCSDSGRSKLVNVWSIVIWSTRFLVNRLVNSNQIFPIENDSKVDSDFWVLRSLILKLNWNFQKLLFIPCQADACRQFQCKFCEFSRDLL